ncbi:MAG: MerR family transcriptional regulator [Anaerolineae bacterium]|jgi:DNA-binding transcriptional MerR regulator|nr:MerR family transcriptional regulator [Anaerolineae bacterium]
MKVNEIARRAGVSPETVRYYARIGLLRPERDDHNDYRRFRERDLCALRFIVHAKQLGFTLSDVRSVLEMAETGHAVCPLVRETLEARLVEKEQEIDALVRIHTRMVRARELWRGLPDRAPRDREICHLVDSLAEAEAVAAP